MASVVQRGDSWYLKFAEQLSVCTAVVYELIERQELPHVRVSNAIRFHDLRHTTASLLMMAGANAMAVQRILRHHDPRITTEIYGHLEPGYLRAEIDRLRFAPPATEESNEALAVVNAPPFAASLLHDSSAEVSGPLPAAEEPEGIPAVALARHRGFEPLTYGSGEAQRSALST
jgi:integrase